MSLFLVKYVLTALVAGALGGAAMEFVMWLIARAGLARGDMVLALGSLLTKKREGAYRVGLILHAIAAFGFALLYVWVMVTLGMTRLPNSLMIGLGGATFQGIVVALTLVWVVAEQHPLEEFKEADLLVGLSHVAGHAAYGAVVGFVVGLSGL